MTDFIGKFPATRPRRLRESAFIRDLVQENHLSVKDLIYPIFVMEGKNLSVPVPSMPGVERLTLDKALEIANECVQLGIPALAIFPVIDINLKN